MSNIRIVTCAFAAAGVLFIGSQAGAQAPSQISACVNSANVSSTSLFGLFQHARRHEADQPVGARLEP